jgi:hypothetical protein
MYKEEGMDKNPWDRCQYRDMEIDSHFFFII